MSSAPGRKKEVQITFTCTLRAISNPAQHWIIFRSPTRNWIIFLTCVRISAGLLHDNCTNSSLSLSLSLIHELLIAGELQSFASQVQTGSFLSFRSSRQDNGLAISRVRIESGKRRLLYSIAQLYNFLPLELSSLSLASFKRHLTDAL